MKRSIVFVIVTLLLMISAGIYLYYGVVFKEARNIASEMPDSTISATTLLKKYDANPTEADLVYLNKTIEITGLITKKTDSVLVLENTVFCLFTKKIKDIPKNSRVTVKGKCIGYDDLFQEVKLDQCTISKPNN